MANQDMAGTEIRERWRAAEEADRENRDEALIDLQFEAGEQWDDTTRKYREARGIEAHGFPLPCLTINNTAAFTGQVIGDRRANATSIKVLPREDGDVKVAEVRSELIRSIELQSRADMVYAQTFGQQVGCGIGNLRVDLDYASDDAFERDLFIRGIANPLAVLWDPMSVDPTGRDASYVFVADRIRKEDFAQRYPDAAPLMMNELSDGNWADDKTVRIADLWELIDKPRTLALMMDGRIEDVTDLPESEWRDRVLVNDYGNAHVRKAPRKFARLTKTNGQEALSDPFELPLPRVPIVKATGRELWVGEKRVRYGLVRFARDPQRLKNYWRSVVAEMLMLAPRDNWIADAKAVEGREADWTETRVYNSGAQAPQPATQMNLAAIVNEAQMCAQDMKDVTGIHEASLGMQGNETSGRAIMARQHEGDIATIIYHDNMNATLREVGEILNALIPIVYDTPRTIRTVGEDDAVKQVRVNDPNAPEHIDLAMGKYDVTISTGPAYMTKRVEAAASMMEAARIAPSFLEVAGDLIAKNQDWPGADEIAARIRKRLPADLLDDDEKEQPDPAAMQAQAMQQQMQQEAAGLEMRLKVAQAEEAEAKARLAKQQALDAEEGVSKDRIAAHAAETNRIKAITAKDFPLPAEAQAILAPLVTQAVMQVLASPDILPIGVQQEIATAAFDDAIPAPQLPPEGGAPMPDGEMQ